MPDANGNFTQADLAAVRRMRASGVASAANKDRSTSFRSDEDLAKLERQILAALGTDRPSYSRTNHSKGL